MRVFRQFHDGVLRSSLGGCQRTLGWAAAPTGRAAVALLRTLKAIHAPLIATSAAPNVTVYGVLAGPIVCPYTRLKERRTHGQDAVNDRRA
jgi:hypothetical protein